MPRDRSYSDTRLERFRHGGVHRVKVINFMSYGDAEFFPGPRLNMILGPNGSGKSSLVCALALGLGGSPSILGRSDKLSGFVQNGKDTATVEIEIIDKEKKCFHVVKRIIDGTSKKGSSTWVLDNKTVSEDKVKSYLSNEFHIQVDNLCQFLPQDKVSYFSKLNDQERLTETLRALLGEEYVTQQTNLSAQFESLRKGEVEVQTLKDRILRCEEELKSCQSAVDAFKEREQILYQVKMLKGKLMYLEYLAIKHEKEKLTKLKGRVKSEIEIIEETLKPINMNLMNVEKKLSKEKQVHSNATASETKAMLMSSEKSRNNKTDHMGKVIDNIDEMKEEILSKQKNIDDKKTQLRTAKEELEAMKNKQTISRDDYNAAFEAHKGLLAEAQADDSQLKSATRDLDRQKTELQRIQSRLERLPAASNREDRIRKLPRFISSKIQSAWDKVKHLKNEVFLPVLEVEISDPLVCRQFETVVNPYQLSTFIVTSERARDAVSKLGVDMLFAKDSQRATISASLKSKYDLRGSLSECIVAPSSVILGLEALCGIDKVLCGGNKTDSAIGGAVDELVGFRVCSTTVLYVVRRSGYGNRSTFMNTSQLRSSYIFQADASSSHAPDARAELEQNLAQQEQQVQKIQNEINQSRSQLDKKQKKLQDLMATVDAYRSHIRTIKTLKSVAQDLENTLAELESVNTQDVVSKIGDYVTRYFDTQTQLIDSVSRTYEGVASVIGRLDDMVSSKLTQFKLESQRDRFKKEGAQYRARQQKLNGHYNEIETAEKQMDHDRKKRLSEFKRYFPTIKEDKKVAEELDAFPDDTGEVKALLATANAKLELMADQSDAIHKYETKKKEAEEYRAKVQRREAGRKSELEAYEREKSQWIFKVQEMVDGIDTKFTQGFKAIQEQGYHCDGRVKLETDEVLSKCGITMLVKFRQHGELQKLSGSTQSGGEKSLCTFLYMLSLTDSAVSPLRVVDEINQGMDQEKERISFYQLVAQCCGGVNKPQYFLITPKLLDGLTYNDDITFHVIFSGKGALPQEEFDCEDILQKRSAYGSSPSHQKRPRLTEVM